MTLADQIRALSGLRLRDVADQVGTSPEYVNTIRAKDRKPELYRGHARSCYHRNKTLGGPGEWTPTLDMELRTRVELGQSFGRIAIAMGVSRSTIAGRVFRLRHGTKKDWRQN